MFLITELAVLLTSNLILSQALGTSTLFIAAGSKKNLLWTAVAITLFTSFGSAAAYIINMALPDEMADLTLLLYTAAVGVLYILMLTILYFADRENFSRSRKYVHLSAFNCAVMGTLFTVTERADTAPELNSFLGFVAAGAQAGGGFILAALILMAAFGRLSSSKVPSAFRGFPSMLIYLGIISMAVYALR